MAAHVLQDFQSAPNNPNGMPTTEIHASEKKQGEDFVTDDVQVTAAGDLYESSGPTEDETRSLRKISAPLPWAGVAMCLIEFAERASYYGSTGPFNNFINRPLPPGGNGAGAVAPGEAGLNQSAGALGRGSVTASALVNMFTFMAYVWPLIGGAIADTKLGRFKTVIIGTAVGGIAHILLVIPAIPSVIANPNGSLGAFIISIVILSGAAGFIKPCLGPMLCDQSPVKVPTIKVLKSGERVIVDPQVTVERYLLVFYFCINCGAFFAVATTYSARFVGFWLAFLLPGVLYIIMPVVLIVASKRLYKAPPQGSVVVEAVKVFRLLLADGGLRRMWKGGDEFWEKAKPSFIERRDGAIDYEKVFWDDKFVDEIKQTVHACAVFAFIPIFAMADGGIGNSINSMSTAMVLNGVPNDLISNFNPLSIIVMAPVLNYGLYPFMAKIGLPLKPMTRMTIGFLLATIGCIIAAIVQWKIYETSPCGYSASTCDDVSTVSLWWQIPIIAIPAVGELFVNVTSYELAYTRSPARMKAFVYALALFNSAVAAAISLGAANAIQDPFLIWPWVGLACATFVIALIFPTYFKHLNEPLSNFADKARMEGREQPKVLAEKESSQ